MRFAMVLGLALFAASAQAQQSDPQPLPAEEPARQILIQTDTAPDNATRLALVDKALALLVQPTRFRGSALCYRGAVLLQLERPDEARAAFDQCLQLRPNDPAVLRAIVDDEMRLNRAVPAARLLIRIAELRPDLLRTLGSGEVSSLLRQLDYVREEALGDTLIDSLVDAGFARDDPSTFSGFVRQSIVHRIRVGKIEAAERLLPSIVDPQSGLIMLVDRQYAPLWPAIDRWAGADLSIQRQALLTAARGTYDLTHSASARRTYVQALAATGHRDDALAVVETWLSEPRVEADEWERSQAIVTQARLLAEKNQRGVAIAAMKMALKDWDKHSYELGNIVPNLATHQVLARDFAGAIDTLDRYRLSKEDLESPASAAYEVVLRGCALQGLGKVAAAQASLQRTRTEYPTAKRALDFAVACVATPDEQAKHWIVRANDPETRSDALVGLVFARYRKRLNRPVLTLEDEMLRGIEDRTDVKQAFDALGRALPPAYEPALDKFNGVPATPAGASGPLAAVITPGRHVASARHAA